MEEGRCRRVSEEEESVLWVFDLDGTLLVSFGREIVKVKGERAGLHPLMEPHVKLPKPRSSDFSACFLFLD